MIGQALIQPGEMGEPRGILPQNQLNLVHEANSGLKIHWVGQTKARDAVGQKQKGPPRRQRRRRVEEESRGGKRRRRAEEESGGGGRRRKVEEREGAEEGKEAEAEEAEEGKEAEEVFHWWFRAVKNEIPEGIWFLAVVGSLLRLLDHSCEAPEGYEATGVIFACGGCVQIGAQVKDSSEHYIQL